MENDNTIKINLKRITLEDIQLLDSANKIQIDLSDLGQPYNFGNQALLHKNKPFKQEFVIKQEHFTDDDHFRKSLIGLGKKILKDTTNTLNNEFKNMLFNVSIYSNPQQEISQGEKIALYHLELY